MPVDFNTAQSLIQQRGVAPPAGIQPGTPQYQQWATEYLQNAVNAGDPAAMQAAGVGSWKGGYSGTGEHGGYDAARGAKKIDPRSLGPNPTPSQIRQLSWDQGWGTDDYGDIPDGAIAQWIAQGKWDANAGRFRNDYGDLVDKPWDDGPISAGRQAEFNTGRYSNPDQVRLNNAVPTGPAAAASGGYDPVDPLQKQLMDMVGSGAGFFGEQGRNNAASLKSGGVWWGQGADFSQAFNPLKPKGGGGGGGAQTNPFTQAAQQPTQNVFGTPGVSTSPTGKTNASLIQNGVNWGGSAPQGPVYRKLYEMYGGGNNVQ